MNETEKYRRASDADGFLPPLAPTELATVTVYLSNVMLLLSREIPVTMNILHKGSPGINSPFVSVTGAQYLFESGERQPALGVGKP
jgi:hypothetical protein